MKEGRTHFALKSEELQKKRDLVFKIEADIKMEPTSKNYIALYKAHMICQAAMQPVGFDGVNFLRGIHISEIVEMSGDDLHSYLQTYMAEQGQKVFEDLQK